MTFHKKYLNQIPKNWKVNAGTILKTASILAEAKKQIPKPSYKELLRELKFSQRTDQRLRKIGKDKRLYDPTVMTSLPDSWGSIERICSLSESQFEDLVDSGLLKPSLTREEIEEFKSGEVREKQDWSNTDKLLTIRVRGVVDAEEAREIVEEFVLTAQGVNRNLGTEVVAIENHELAENLERKQQRQSEQEIERRYREGLKIGKKICRCATKMMRANVPDWLNKNVNSGLKTPTWSMQEVVSPQDYEDLKVAFAELNIDLDVDELQRNLEIGQRFYEKLKEQKAW